MSWLEVAAIVVLLISIGAGGFLVAQRPAFWWGLGAVVFKAVLPFLMKRMPPEEEAEMQACHRSGGRWDNMKKRCLPLK
jgi:hypothetical protein